jgi:hypothetical protein
MEENMINYEQWQSTSLWARFDPLVFTHKSPGWNLSVNATPFQSTMYSMPPEWQLVHLWPLPNQDLAAPSQSHQFKMQPQPQQ